MDRKKNLKKIEDKSKVWDIAVIGGGASGLGVALDALSRGLSVVLIEKADFAAGTSSRSTKLVHGGVRYLAQGDVSLVFEALRERGRLLQNAPHLTYNQPFIIPIYTLFDRIQYSVGLKIYDWMAGRLRLGKSRFISKKETIERLPQVKREGLKGGVVYHDGQFDDARLALSIAMTCNEMGGCMLNYVKVQGLIKDDSDKTSGIQVQDVVTKQKYEIRSKMVVNATGVFADKILKMDKPEAPKSIQPSQGIHLVLDQSFLGGKDALMIPKTSDGRVLFAVPWHGKLVVGTTDTLREKAKLEPEALANEVEFILETAQNYLTKAPQKSDVLSVFAGLRPLAAPKEGSTKTKEISRSHKVTVSESNLVSITGGKWTTFRKMGEDTVEYFYKVTGEKSVESRSSNIKYNGFTDTPKEGHWKGYGENFMEIQKLIETNQELGEKLHEKYPYTKAEVVWSVRNEMAVKVEDVLSRRLRILLLDSKAALKMAPLVAELMASELGKDESWVKSELADFEKLANKYILK
ncbi:Glycerol-3-phosphate dehydrogenase [Indibacter alkaliphilus LW1]|uniref:Glycerol-3-phosphate dehydrogenase n=1 Tax=Indibacter alkaliphilus (strain CCUG 57479 / KCTC 22604 / LW1) TaxID=1189612 RepID=S2DR05_INDAL|nr:glycerol-3-phosphate dehydrogenase/oxidase [Indibacter alkaliphilus]EOZ99700.1 Glycerol-3-phosphate dehydrogenase [Indibacter alkaliphilus LW1]